MLSGNVRQRSKLRTRKSEDEHLEQQGVGTTRLLGGLR